MLALPVMKETGIHWADYMDYSTFRQNQDHFTFMISEV
jgi:hypothetical protein